MSQRNRVKLGIMGLDHGGTRGTSPPQNWSRGDARANCPLRFLSYIYIYIYKRSVLWPSKYAKICFRRGSAPDPAGGAHDAPPVGWRGDTPHHTPPHLAPTHLRRSPCVPLRIPARSTPMLGINVRRLINVSGLGRT